MSNKKEKIISVLQNLLFDFLLLLHQSGEHSPKEVSEIFSTTVCSVSQSLLDKYHFKQSNI